MTPTVIDDTVKDIMTSRVYDVAIETPLAKARRLSAQIGCDVYLKREDLQPVHSFKIRGAYNKITQLSDAEKARGVIAASAGNHGQGVALAAKKLGLSAVVVMPRTTPSIKVEAVKSYGAEVELAGDNYSEAADYCEMLIKKSERTFIHPYNDPLVIAGQGTVGQEVLEQLPSVTHVFVPVGGGGLIAGISAYIKALRPEVKIVSVEPEDSNAMQQSVRQNKRVLLPHVGIFADGVAVKQVGTNTFKMALHKVDDFITVTTDEICAATKAVFEDTRSIVEPAGALGVAGIMKYRLRENAKAVAICSGANMTFERLQQIAERTLIGSGKEALFSVAMPEKPGSLQTFCNKVVRGRSISEFSYRLQNRSQAHILVGISVNGANDREALRASILSYDYNCQDLSLDEITKEHTRYMIGGPASTAEHEHLYLIEFPERPGALVDFLTVFDNRWNISLFHYRSAASDNGRVLMGFEAPDQRALERDIRRTGFAFTSVKDNKSLSIFIT